MTKPIDYSMFSAVTRQLLQDVLIRECVTGGIPEPCFPDPNMKDSVAAIIRDIRTFPHSEASEWLSRLESIQRDSDIRFMVAELQSRKTPAATHEQPDDGIQYDGLGNFDLS